MYFIIQCFGKGIFTPVVAPHDDTNYVAQRFRLKLFTTRKLAVQYIKDYCKSVCTVIKLEPNKFK